MSTSYETIAKALFINYESLYDVDIDTGMYYCFYESKSYEKHGLEKHGEDFFSELEKKVPEIIAPEDQDYVLEMLSKEALRKGTQGGECYSFIYRVLRGGEPVYHKIRAIQGTAGESAHVYLGVRDIDYLIRQERAHSEEVRSLLQKERNHMNAILASTEGYLEINLSKDMVLERSIGEVPDSSKPLSTVPDRQEFMRYSTLSQWLIDHLLATNRDVYQLVTKNDYLIDAFEKGERRVSLDFSYRNPAGGLQPCKQVYYLYQDETSKDIMSFCVVYDLTEQQKKEKEMEELERKLQLSRIRNFTGQMQPHFLYNALGSIQEIILEDPDYAFKLLGDFTTYLRGCIKSMADDRLVSFSQELDNIRAYVNIEKMRFGSKLDVVFAIQSSEFEVLPLSIQPLVENAIRHGIYQKGKEGGRVVIRTREDDTRWIVEIEDNGVGFDASKLQNESEQEMSESTGLKNLTFRLNNVLDADVNLKSVIGEGTTVTVTIPKAR
ncbi:MAG: histidine kinase [Firmicutes bacterium]|nr:histidine kinase [Bacillota bacterium]